MSKSLACRAAPAVVRLWRLDTGTVTAEWQLGGAMNGGWSGIALAGGSVPLNGTASADAAAGAESEDSAAQDVLLLEATIPPRVWRVGQKGLNGPAASALLAGGPSSESPQKGMQSQVVSAAAGEAHRPRLVCTPGN